MICSRFQCIAEDPDHFDVDFMKPICVITQRTCDRELINVGTTCFCCSVSVGLPTKFRISCPAACRKYFFCEDLKE